MKSVEDLDLLGIEAFVHVANHSGIRAASRESGVGQPTLSKRLARLEATLGCQLLTRGAVMKLTADGQRLLPQATSLLRSAHKLMDGDTLPGEKAFHLGIACSACLGLADKFLLAAELDGYAVEPQEGTSTALLQGILEGEIDAMLGRFQLDQLPAGIVGQVVATDRLGIICPTGHELDRDQIYMSEVGAFPIVGLQQDLSPGLEAELSACWEKSGFKWNPVRRASGPGALLSFVQANIGVTVLPDRAFLPHETLRFHEILDGYAVSKIVLTWKENDCIVGADDLLRWILDI